MTPEEEFEKAKKVLGQRIGRRREKIGLSQENLARLANVNRSHMSDIETGKKEPGFWTLIRIAGVLGTTSGQLLRGLRWKPTDRVADYLKDPGS